MPIHNRGSVAEGTSNELRVKLVTNDRRAFVVLEDFDGELVAMLTKDQASALSGHLMVAAMQASIHENEVRDG